jgi:hypothetical protein
MRKLFILLLVVGLAGTANALNLHFSTDGSTPLPDGATIDVAPGSTTTLHILSDTGGAQGAYWHYLEMNLPQAGSIPFDSIYGRGTKTDHSTASLMSYLLTVPDAASGVDWSFALVISPTAATDGSDDFYFWNTVPNDSTYSEDKRVNVHIIPEPGSIALIGLGSILLLRRRRLFGGNQRQLLGLRQRPDYSA